MSSTITRSSALVQFVGFVFFFFLLINNGTHGSRISRMERISTSSRIHYSESHRHHAHNHSHDRHHTLLTVPHVGASLKNFKGETVQVIKEVGKSYVVLPHLQLKDHLWQDFTIQLKCSFNQPIQWIYDGHGAPVVKTDTYRNAPDIHNISSYHYGATVTFSFTHFKQTGKYSCQSISDPKAQASLFVFVPGEKIFVSDDEKEESNQPNATTVSTSTITIHGDPLSQWIRLPCSVSNPNVSVQLFKDGSELHLSRKKVYFDPQVGFEIYKDSLKNPWGEYLCYEQNSKQSLKIHLQAPQYILPEDVFQVQEENKVFRYSENENTEKSNAHVHIKFHHDKRNDILACCAFDVHGNRLNEYPVMKYLSCESTSECHILEKHLDARKCSRRSYSCEGKRTKRNCIGYELTDFNDAGIIQCSLGEHRGEYHQFSKTGEVVLTKFDVIPRTEDILSIEVEDSKTPNKKIFTCLANSFFFSHGIRWAYQNDSHHKKFIDGDYPFKDSIELGPEEAKKVFCYAPIWNSHEWRNVSVLYPDS